MGESGLESKPGRSSSTPGSAMRRGTPLFHEIGVRPILHHANGDFVSFDGLAVSISWQFGGFDQNSCCGEEKSHRGYEGGSLFGRSLWLVSDSVKEGGVSGGRNRKSWHGMDQESKGARN